MNKFHNAARISLALALFSAALGGCASTSVEDSPNQSASEGVSEAHASRVRFYDSAGEMAADSTIVVEGRVTSQRTATDITPDTVFTISTVTVTTAIKGTDLESGATVEVRQFGDSKQIGPAPLLQQDADYLLYLTASGLPGELASQYYVTGGSAGLYKSTSSSTARRTGTTYSQLVADEGDALPAQLSASESTD